MKNQVPYSEIKILTETNLRRISKAREKPNELAGESNHLVQIKQIHEKRSRASWSSSGTLLPKVLMFSFNGN